jgi:hypothetical protein
LNTKRRFSQNLAGNSTEIKGKGFGFRALGVFLFCVGVLIGMSILGLSVYADFEAALFDIPEVAEKSITPFACPILIDAGEVGVVQARIKNDSSEPIQYETTGYISQVSTGYQRKDTHQLIFKPNEAKILNWHISAEDAGNQDLILVKVYIIDGDYIPAQEASCGVYVVDLPGRITGGQVSAIFHALGVILILGGVCLWRMCSNPKLGIKPEVTWGVISLMIALFIGLLTNWLGFFALAVGLFYISVLLVGVMIPHLIFSRRKA